MLLVSCPPSMYHYEETGFVFLIPGSPLQVLASCYYIPAKAPSCAACTSLIPSASPHCKSAPAPNHLGGSLLNSLQFSNVLPVLGSPKGITIRRIENETMLYQFLVYVEWCFFFLILYWCRASIVPFFF